MMARGIRLLHARTIPDNEEIIVENVREVSAEYDCVFTTGGIGPTHDDITAGAMAKAFNVPLLLHPEARAILLRHYGAENLIEARLRMAMIPEGGTLIDNPVSAAPGFKIKNVYVMAGVPKIMQAMLDSILPELQGGAPIQSRTITCALAESRIAKALGELAVRYAEVDIGSYPHFDQQGYNLNLVLRGSDIPVLEQATEELFALLTAMEGKPVRLNSAA
jgi:molybdopterin-biosynthesis enzyme MoeA-like protein